MAIKFEITMTNKWLYSLITIGILMFFVVGLTIAFNTNDPTTFGHTSGEMEVSISGSPRTLQNAIDGGSLVTAEQMNVSVSGVTMTLQQAIDGGNLGGGASGAVVLFDDNGDNETVYTLGFGSVNGLDNLTVTPLDSEQVITVIAQVGFHDPSTADFKLHCNTIITENGISVATGVYEWSSDGRRPAGNEITMLFVNTNPVADVPLTYAVQVEGIRSCFTPIADPDTSLMVRMERLI